MAFWASNNVIPLRKFRFTIQIGNESIFWYAKSVTQPSFDISISEHRLVNHVIKYPGITTWNDVDIVLVDVEGQGKSYYEKLTKIGYNYTGSGKDGMKKSQYSDKPFIIQRLKDDGEIQDTWKLINPFIKSVKYGDLDYSSEDLLEITITVAYDSAEIY